MESSCEFRFLFERSVLTSIDLHVDHEAQGLALADTFAPGQHIFDLRVFFDVLSASALPGHERSRLAGEISLGKDMVGEVCQALTLEAWQIEADALGGSLGTCTVHVFIVHPDGHGGIHDDEVKGGFRATASTASEQVVDGGAGLETQGGAVLPPDDRTPLGVYKSLLENVIEDVLEVKEMPGITDVEELSGNLLVDARRLVVGDPELSRVSLRAKS